MDSYPTLLSPIDNFAFSHFSNSPTTNKPGSQGFHHDAPHTPLPRANNDWHELLDGPQAGQFSFNMWDDNPFSARRQTPSASPWRSDVFRTLSDSFLDSPLSSSSYLSSATGSPSVVPSSTCSPWETCPGLAPISPDLPLLNELNLQFAGSIPFSTSDDGSSNAFNSLSLGSPLRSPILLPYELDSGAIDPYNLMHTQPQGAATTIEPSHLTSNALALDLSADAGNVALELSQTLPPFGETVASPPHSSRSSPLTEPLDAPSHTAGSYDTFPHSASFPSESYMHSRATRRKTSHVDYAEAGYDVDSDDEFEPTGAYTVRFTKRRKASAESTSFMFSESEEDDVEFSEDGSRRNKKGGRRGAIKGGSAAAAKRKCKRRHHCPRNGCASSFTRVTDMERHIASVHRAADSDANRCTFCRKAFSREDAVLRHENDSCPERPRKKSSNTEPWV